MKVVIDACSVINLHNGGALETVCSIPTIGIQIGPIVGGECSEDCAAILASLHEREHIEYLADSGLDADEFIKFASDHRLGDGESECIMLAGLDPEAMICCDDMRGRRVADLILGDGRVTGSIGLLKEAVSYGAICADQAFEMYLLMKNSGGFLPNVDRCYFDV